MNKKRLGERLLESGVISGSELEQALAHQKKTKKRLGETLRELGFIDEDRLAWCLAEMIQAPVLNLNNVFIDPKVLQKIPRERCEQLKVLPISVIEDTLTLAMADPFDVTAYDLAQRLARMPVRVVVATESSILKALEKHTDDELGLEEAIRKIPGLDMGSEDELGLDQQDQDYQKAVAQALEDFRKEGQNRPVIRLVNSIIRDAIKMRASDIHIEPMETSCMVRYRIDGLLRNIVSMPAFLHPRNVCRIKILGRMDIAEHRLPQDGSCRVRFQGNELDLRISTMPTQHGEKVVIRVLNRQEAQIRLESMGLLPDSLAQVEKMLRMAQGIILLTGPTGSGKTSTLYAMLHRLKGEHFNIVTLEDPIEYNVPGITQTQVQEKAGFTFAAGFRSILRQDPDVIMVGEIRDEPTADIAFNAAVTGHLVLSTLHTNDSCSVPVRLRELGVSPYLITTGLKGVISQRLVRRLCMHCREPYRPDADICKILGLNPRDPATLYRAVGCKVCGGSGYYGRVGVFEILILSEKMKEMIFAGATGAQLAEQAARDGLRDLMEDAALRVIQGVTSLEEVMRVVPLEERRALCPQCQHRVERYYQTCPFCSFHLWRNLCTTCGKEMEEGWRFCPYCAHQPSLGVTPQPQPAPPAAPPPAIPSVPHPDEAAGALLRCASCGMVLKPAWPECPLCLAPRPESPGPAPGGTDPSAGEARPLSAPPGGAAAEPAPAPAPAAQRPPVAGPAPGNGAQTPLVLVTDDPGTLMEVRRAAAAAGLDVIQAGGLDEALRRMDGAIPRGIILETFLSGIDVAEACRKLRSQPRVREVPIAAVLPGGLEEEAARIQAAGIDQVLYSPVEAAQLQAFVAEAGPAARPQENAGAR